MILASDISKSFSRNAFILLGFLLVILPHFAYSQEGGAVTAQTFLNDYNEDGTIKLLAFGDSTTFGFFDENRGDGSGYPARLEEMLNVPVDNRGSPGEMLNSSGILRFPSTAAASNADLVILLEGINDFFLQIGPSSVGRNYQRAVNVARAMGMEIALATLTPACCGRDLQQIWGQTMSDQARAVAAANGLPVVDFARAFARTCGNEYSSCPLLNSSDGLHPTSLGYRVMAETAAATLLGVDIFGVDGKSQLAQALGVAVSDLAIFGAAE